MPTALTLLALLATPNVNLHDPTDKLAKPVVLTTWARATYYDTGGKLYSDVSNTVRVTVRARGK